MKLRSGKQVQSSGRCPVCNQIDDGDTVLCEGVCNLWYHVDCVGMTLAQAEMLSSWVCSNCKNDQNDSNLSWGFANSNSSTRIENTTLTETGQNDNESAKSKSQKSKSSRSTATSSKRAALLAEKSQVTQRKLEAVKLEMKILNEKQQLIEEQLQLVNKLESNGTSSVSSASDVTRKDRKVRPNANENVVKDVKCMSLEERINLLDVKNSHIESKAVNTGNKPYQREKFDTRDLSQWHARQSLPKELPRFGGATDEWSMFYNAFLNSTELCKLSHLENLLRLQKCLHDPAKSLVKHLLTDPKNVPTIMDTLKMLFGNPQRLFKEQLTLIKAQNPVIDQDLSSIVKFSLAVKNFCSVIESSELNEHFTNPLLLEELIGKLTPSLQYQWAQHTCGRTVNNIKEFEMWLSEISRNLCYTLPTLNFAPVQHDKIMSKGYEKKRTQSKTEARVNAIHQEAPKRNEISCLACGGNCSEIAKCTKFLGFDDDQRWQVVRKCGLCKQCLTKHYMKPPFRCKYLVKCDKENCEGKHHPLMHRKTNPPVVVNQPPVKNETSCSRQINSTRSVLRYLPVRIGNGKKEITVIAFFDQGSTGTFANVDCAKALEISGPQSELHLKFGGDNHHTEHESMTVEFTIAGMNDNARKYKLKNVHTVKKLGLPEQTMNYENLSKRFQHLCGLPVTSYQKSSPAILIGINNWKLALEREFRVDDKVDGPIASCCLLGWTVYAGTNDGHQSINYCEEIECMYYANDDDELNEAVKRYFSIDSLVINTPIHTTTSKEEKRALSIMNQTVKRIGNSYEIGLLWRSENVQLPDNREMALKRMYSLESRFRRDPELGVKMRAQMDDYLKKGYAKILDESELSRNYDRTWYLPVFPAINANKPEKIRMVFDAKAQVNGTSLNSQLLKGPDQLTTLIGILLRFRQRRVGLTGDIREMYHQVHVISGDQQVQRFLWRQNESKEPSTYMLQVMTFGATCSPSCAQFIKNLNGQKFEVSHPRAFEAIKSNHYVDDLLESMDTEEEIINLANDVKMIHANASFEIRNWRSNSVNVLKTIGNTADVQKNMNIDLEDETEKVLGLWWHCKSDHFTYSLKYNKGNGDVLKGNRKPTKRELLRVLMSIYDPLGLIAHYTSYLKTLLQEVWRTGVNWDDEVEDNLIEKWNSWLSALKQIELLEIPRCYLQSFASYEDLDVELHVLVDSSKDCCCAVAYLRLRHRETGVIECTLVASKTRVAPLKLLSIPRLELTAAVIGAKLNSTIRNSLSINLSKSIFWSDSRTVLSWIRADTRKIKGQFVAFRISEIQESTNIDDWRYVPSKLNVADDATKWAKKFNVNADNRWFKGPPFLYREESSWPQDITIDYKTKEEMMLVKIHANGKQNHLIKFENFSKWSRLLRAVAYVKRFCDILKARIKKTSVPAGDLSSCELLEAERLIYRTIQTSHYSDELRDLQDKKADTVSRGSQIYKLSPYVDEFGIIRSRGRIDAATCVPFETKRPIILPAQNRATRLLVEMYHNKFLHIHHETVINEVRQRYLILSCRRLLKIIRGDCVRCAYLNAKPTPPQMAPLPFERLAPYTLPFTYVGVDCMGPIDVHVGRRKEKRWICLFTCLIVRGIHLEILHGMDSDTFIMAFRKFTQRRGEPKKVFSDNGTNFVGAERELRESMKDINMQKVAASFQSPELEWKFNPPDSPHMGGSWERLVKSVKIAFYATLPSRTLTDPMLASYMVEIENIINSRPLTYLPLDSEVEESLTPNHFIRGSSSGCKPIAIFNDDIKFVKRNWRMTQLYAQRYWERWVVEFLPDLTRRSKWFELCTPLQEGDLVLVVDPRYIRNCWLRGRIESVKLGKDGQVRHAAVRTSSGMLVRPAVRLAKLDIEKSCDLASKLEQQVTGGDLVMSHTESLDCFVDRKNASTQNV